MQLYYQTAIIGRRDLALAPDPRSGFEMTLLRMLAFRPAGATAADAAAGSDAAARRAARRGPQPRPPRRPPPRCCRSTRAASRRTVPWAQIVSQLELAGAARQLANHCAFIGRHGAVVRLALDPRNQLVRTAAQEEKLAQALSRYFGEPVRLEFQQAVAQGAETPAQAQRRASEPSSPRRASAFEADAGVQGPARALRRHRAPGHRASGKMNPATQPATERLEVQLYEAAISAT